MNKNSIANLHGLSDLIQLGEVNFSHFAVWFRCLFLSEKQKFSAPD